METSGRENVADPVASRRPANAANSVPAPTAGPWTRTVSRLASRSSQSPALADDRIRCADAGSLTVPNSARSPPQEKVDPMPVKRTGRQSPGAVSGRRASTRASRMAAE